MRWFVATLAMMLLFSVPVSGQAATAPDFAVGDTTLYAHASDDSLSVWMNAHMDDGAESPYYLTGEPTSTTGVAMAPAADESFEARIALTPGLMQTIVLDGTITVQAYIGGGLATAGEASIATSLAVDGEVVASADAKDHTMTPKATAGTYDPIDWTMDVAGVEVAEGSTLEWIISGTIEAGNNIYLATYEARGRSHIILPVSEIVVDTAGDETGNETVNETIEVGNETDSPGNATEGPDGSNETVEPDTPAGNETGNETVDGAPADKESPGLALPAMILAIIATLQRRRAAP